ncbi:hypothetical protein B0H19DRAFT_424284 [Mycena capillaripes]|nr:hypothetical protein B0H19DRAFT_424284 [Mycena capillaripes]
MLGNNNRKVLAVRLQMQDMMSALFELRDIRDLEAMGPKGTTLKGRLSAVLDAIATAITECANMCDMYIQKPFLAKMVKAYKYEQRLTDWMVTFSRHKEEVLFVLQMNTRRGVHITNKRLEEQGADVKHIRETMHKLFRKLDTPREQDVLQFIKAHGDVKTCIDDDATLRDLVSLTGRSFSSFDLTRMGNDDRATEALKSMLNRELDEDMDKAFEKHMALFEAKLKLQHQQLEDTIISARDNIAGVVTSTGENIIDTLSGGAFKKVVDEELQGIWRAQGWKGNVKARNFALALNYFYVEKFTVRAESGDVEGSDISDAGSDSESTPDFLVQRPTSSAVAYQGLPTPATHKDDRWALAYIGVPYLIEIAEAVDDDGAGFISIHEANDFAHRRPKGWSLVSWVAYFAAGWHTSVTWYKNRIYNILYAMVSVAKRVKSANVEAVNSYLAGEELQRLELLLRSTRSTDRPVLEGTPLRSLTDEYQTEEAAKFEDRLKTLNYELDDVATIQLITKKRRVEHYVYPLLYQLLKRHFDILRLACMHVLEDSEFTIMSTSLASIFQVVDARKKRLKAIFKSHSLDVEERLEKFAFGMFQPVSDDYPRVPRNNTIRTFVEDDAFKFSDEDLGPESDDDEEKAEGIIVTIDPNILRYRTKKPRDGAESELTDVIAFKRYCDNCAESIYDTRLFCIQCMDDEYLETIDLCSKCRESTPRNEDVIHTRSHLLIKTYRPIHDGDMALMVPEAEVIANRVKKAFKARRPRQLCCCCGESVSPLFWVCTVCTQDTYVCKTCDAERAIALPNGENPKHKLLHPLLQIFDSEPIPEARSVSTDVQFTGIEARISALEERFERRFASLEVLLNNLGDRMNHSIPNDTGNGKVDATPSNTGIRKEGLFGISATSSVLRRFKTTKTRGT